MVSGSREYKDIVFLRTMLEDAAGDARRVTVVHGAARGADSLANEVAEEFGFNIESYPADWSFGNRGGSIRNAEMLAQHIDIALFFFKKSEANVGTRDAAKKAITMSVPSRYFIDNQEYDLTTVKRVMRPF